MATDENSIPSDISKRICNHMNDDHEISVYAFAKSALTSAEEKKGLSNTRMTSISLSGYEISFSLGTGKDIEDKNVHIPFDPPLSSSNEARNRIIQDHHAVFSPKISWLVTDPMALSLFLLAITLAYATYFLQHEGIVSQVNQFPSQLETLVDALFSSRSNFASAVINLWYLYVVAHFLESLVLVYACHTQLKLRKGTLMKWFVLGVCVSYPISRKILHYVEVNKKLKKGKDEKKKGI